MKGFFEFLMSKQVRGNLIAGAIGLIVVVIGSVVLETSKISIFVSVVGAILMITSTNEIMKKISQK